MVPGDINSSTIEEYGHEPRSVIVNHGLTFKFLASEIKLVKHVLENNRFLDVDMIPPEQAQPPLIIWSSAMIK